MRVLESRIDIDAPLDAVWAVLTDFPAFPEWNPFILSVAGTPTTGRRLAVRIRPPGGMALTLKPTVTTAVAPRHFAWLGRLGLPRLFDGAHEFVLEPDGSGGTSFIQRETFRGVLVPLLGAVLRRTERGFAAMNEALKTRVESQSSFGGGSSPKKPVTRRMRPSSSSATSTPAMATVPSPPTSSQP